MPWRYRYGWGPRPWGWYGPAGWGWGGAGFGLGAASGIALGAALASNTTPPPPPPAAVVYVPPPPVTMHAASYVPTPSPSTPAALPPVLPPPPISDSPALLRVKIDQLRSVFPSRSQEELGTALLGAQGSVERAAEVLLAASRHSLPPPPSQNIGRIVTLIDSNSGLLLVASGHQVMGAAAANSGHLWEVHHIDATHVTIKNITSQSFVSAKHNIFTSAILLRPRQLADLHEYWEIHAGIVPGTFTLRSKYGSYLYLPPKTNPGDVPKAVLSHTATIFRFQQVL